MPTNATIKNSAFAKAVQRGLTSEVKNLPSRYIYDKAGDALFQQIMQMPEYYLTRCETEIFEKQGIQICKHFCANGPSFNLVELGAGDGVKTQLLIKNLIALGGRPKYMPVDISINALKGLESRLGKEFPELDIHPWEGSYFEMLSRIDEFSDSRKVILFLGSNLGNMEHEEARGFLQGLSQAMNPSDLLFIGLDLKKDPQKVRNAYNDPQGLTAAFNKNILHRINRELGGNFKPELFLHWETYNPESGSARSYLVAKEDMRVSVEELGLTIHFKAWETIYTELSQKYDDPIVQWLAEGAQLDIVDSFMDSNASFKNYLFRPAVL